MQAKSHADVAAPEGPTPLAASERTRSDPNDKRREQMMPAEWVDFKGLKAKVSMETVLSHYDLRLRRVGADEFRGKCPLPTTLLHKQQ